ncbi:MAG: M24 family metallopeptidase [Bacillota bacterium]
MILTPRTELEHRLGRLQASLAAQGLDGALLHGTTNLFYFTGTAQQAHLWVPVQGRPVLLVRRTLERARRESALEQILPLTSLRELSAYLGGARQIGMELDILPVTQFRLYERYLPGVAISDIGGAVRLLRAVKSPYEVERLRAAARVADQSFRAVRAALREGMTELELSAVAEAAERRGGTQGHVRWHAVNGFECPPMLLLAGESALAFSLSDTPFAGEGLTPAAPYGAGRRVILRGMPVCMDHPSAVDGYVHDQTRTLAIGGLDGELTRAYDLCRAILAMFEAEARPGVTGEALWEKSLAMAREAGLEEQFMGYGENRVRFLGHGTGLELDELPVLAPRQQMALEPGHIIAVEPKFFFPGKGAVGLENTYVVTPTGVERLSISDEELAVV